MKILELFSGSAIFSNTARARGHEARTLDFNPSYNATYCADITAWDAKAALVAWRPDVIWASPDCTYYSLANGARLNKYWDEQRLPIHKNSIKAVEVVKATLAIIEELHPKRFFIENPVGMLRLMPFMPKSCKRITYCAYGEKIQKPTHIWTDSTWVWIARAGCQRVAAKCGHANRIDRDGVRNMRGKKFERSKLPAQLCLEIIRHLEVELEGPNLVG